MVLGVERRYELDNLRSLAMLSPGAQAPVLGQTPLSAGDALQMLGRAGRHGQELEGYGFLLAPHSELGEWRGSLVDGHAVHSQLLDSLADHSLLTCCSDVLAPPGAKAPRREASAPPRRRKASSSAWSWASSWAR
jgi:hypothetical protein